MSLFIAIFMDLEPEFMLPLKILKIPHAKADLLTLSNLKLPLSPCCSNSRLAVDEDDSQWVANEKKLAKLHFHISLMCYRPRLL